MGNELTVTVSCVELVLAELVGLVLADPVELVLGELGFWLHAAVTKTSAVANN